MSSAILPRKIMKPKNILITGATGDIGTALIKQLAHTDHQIYAPVRNAQKAQERFGTQTNIHAQECILEDYKSMLDYSTKLANEGIGFDIVILLAGIFKLDKTFLGDTSIEKEKTSIEAHMRSNVLTAETTVEGLIKAYGERLEHTILVPVATHAVDFPVGHSFRINEEGYVQSKICLVERAGEWDMLGTFGKVIVEKPGLIDSEMTRETIPEVLADPSVPRITPDQYASDLIQRLGLL